MKMYSYSCTAFYIYMHIYACIAFNEKRCHEFEEEPRFVYERVSREKREVGSDVIIISKRSPSKYFPKVKKNCLERFLYQ